jgi:hypothetical protein
LDCRDARVDNNSKTNGKMKKTIQILIIIILVGGWIFIIISGFLAYFVSSYDAVNKVPVDGLGREIMKAPFLAKFLLIGNSTWAGLKWMIVDYIVFWGFVALTGFLLNQKIKLES